MDGGSAPEGQGAYVACFYAWRMRHGLKPVLGVSAGFGALAAVACACGRAQVPKPLAARCTGPLSAPARSCPFVDCALLICVCHLQHIRPRDPLPAATFSARTWWRSSTG